MMKKCGVKTKKMSTPISLELAKIVVDTTYYGWLIKDLEKFKTISSIERTGYFAKLFLKNYSEAYKWNYICAQKIKSNDWNKHLFGKWEENINEDCSKELIFLEKNLLSEKEIKSAKTAAKDWLKKNIN